MENKNKEFSYTYSAKEQEEIKRIRKKYLPEEEDKMEKLRRLDTGVYRKGSSVSLIVGVVGALILGGGMSLSMVWQFYFAGITIGIIGLAVIFSAYPLYSYIIKKEREKIAPEIVRLTDELMK